MEKYLKSEQYYNDLYDKFTIEECYRWGDEKDFEELPSIKNKDPEKQKIKKEFTVKVLLPTALYFIKGERYKNKSEIIRQWMSRDRMRDEKLTNAIEPKNIRCPDCSSFMDCTLRTLHTDIDDKNNRVLFFFECSACHRRRAYWEGGEEWIPQPNLCPKCKAEMNSEHSRKDNIITTTHACLSCSYQEKDALDLDEQKEETIDPNFEADRKKYCLSDKEGFEYVSSSENLKRLTDKIKEREKNKEAYVALAKLKKLTIIQIQNLLAPILEKENYINFRFGQPEMDKDVRVEFTIQDNKESRAEYDSRMLLKKLIEKTLIDTNWRLMSDEINYRLGILSGRLRGYEKEEDLLKLIR